MCLGSAELVDIFFNLQIWPLISSQSLDQKQCLVLHLKNLFHICLVIKDQGFWMTFKVCNHGSKYSYLLHEIGFVDSQFGTTVSVAIAPCIPKWVGGLEGGKRISKCGCQRLFIHRYIFPCKKHLIYFEWPHNISRKREREKKRSTRCYNDRPTTLCFINIQMSFEEDFSGKIETGS